MTLSRTFRAIAVVTSACFLLAAVATAQTKTETPPASGSDAPSTQPATQPSTQPAAEPSRPSRDRGWISGTILDDEGKPMAELEVRADSTEPMALGGPGGGRKSTTVYTDKEGNFTFKELKPGGYIIIAGSTEIGWIYREAVAEGGKETKMGPLELVKI